ncbi:hypothetical protein ACFL47_10170, partial [Candidatus Latescibacterota bacterium]
MRTEEETMMKTIVLLVWTALFAFSSLSNAETVLEPFTYSEDFETRELGAWAAYPHWEDTSYNEYFRVDTMVHGDSNISIEQVVTPYTNVDNYAGAQKLLDMYLVPGSSVALRFYLKTHAPFEFVKVRLAAGPDGKVDYTVTEPQSNRWVWLKISFADFVGANPQLAGKDRIRVNALAVLAKIPDADPAMPFYFGLDDIVVKGARPMAFQFAKPAVFKLSEWKPYIPEHCYHRGDSFNLHGQWPLNAERVSLKVVSFSDRTKELAATDLRKQDGMWSLKPMPLNYPNGLYLGILRAHRGNELLAETEFTIHIAPEDMAGNHPRLWFDAKEAEQIKSRLASPKFKSTADGIRSNALSIRTKNPLESIMFDIDQFPEEDWLASLDGWFDRVRVWRNGVYYNTLAYTFFDDQEAGKYARDVLVTISKFPYLVHPWFIKRGRHIYYPLGEAGSEFAIGYDCLYHIMTENERETVRNGLWKNIVLGCHRGYVENNLTTNNTSNWVSNIVSGSLMCQAVVYGDRHETEMSEPYLTGAMFKEYALIQSGFGSDGGYGEPNGYYYFTMDGLSEALPAIENVFDIDMSSKIHRSYTELIWAGNIKKKYTYYYGKSSGGLRPLTNWAWLLPKYKDPLLGWFYHFMKSGETIMDAIYDTENVPRESPFNSNPVRVFRDLGTTVFKSGWDEDDFIFVMRTGPFYNHQFMDQGSFWLSDHGSLFIERRHGSTEPYVGALLYEPWYIQPVSHSTILINNNHQSQRTGDVLNFAEGFEDQASINHFLDGRNAAFSSGDIGKLYWGKVESMQRNILYIKPGTLLMLDTVTPANNDVDVNLLYQTLRLEDITANNNESSISKDGNTLHITHIHPEHRKAESVETPHYFYTLLRGKPLKREGMLKVSVRTDGVPLVVANMLTATSADDGAGHGIVYENGDGFVRGEVRGTPFAFSTRPYSLYDIDDISTDAL